MKNFLFIFLGYVLAAIVGVFRRKFPLIVRIETTNLCNANCTFCPRESIGREKGFMDQGLYEKIITDCADNWVLNNSSAQLRGTVVGQATAGANPVRQGKGNKVDQDFYKRDPAQRYEGRAFARLRFRRNQDQHRWSQCP